MHPWSNAEKGEARLIAPVFWNCFKALARTSQRGIQPPKMAAPGRIDVWRLQGFPEVSSSEIVGLPSPGIAPAAFAGPSKQRNTRN